MADMRARYGAVAANLARVADQIAARMMVDPARTDGQAMPGLAHPHLKNGDPA
jgi:P2-related tail formation protein